MGPCPGMKRTASPKREQSVANRIQQVPVIAAGEIRTPDRALEQHVPDLHQAGLGLVEDDVARGMAGAVDDLQGRCRRGRPDRRGPATARDRRAPPSRRPNILAWSGSCVEQKGVIPVRAQHRHPQPLRQLDGAAYMVDVTMGQQDLDRGDPRLPAIRARMRSTSPPGSTTAAWPVPSHQSRVQFCSKGVTGTIR